MELLSTINSFKNSNSIHDDQVYNQKDSSMILRFTFDPPRNSVKMNTRLISYRKGNNKGFPQEFSEQIRARPLTEVPAGASFPNVSRRGLSIRFLHSLMTAWHIVSSSMPSSKRLPTRSMIYCGSCIPIILKGKGKACPQDYEILASLAGYADRATRYLGT